MVRDLTGTVLSVCCIQLYERYEWFGCSVLLEEGYSKETADALRKKGHVIEEGVGGQSRAVFGRGQIIKRNPKTGVLWGGSEPRADGQCLGW